MLIVATYKHYSWRDFNVNRVIANMNYLGITGIRICSSPDAPHMIKSVRKQKTNTRLLFRI